MNARGRASVSARAHMKRTPALHVRGSWPLGVCRAALSVQRVHTVYALQQTKPTFNEQR